MHLKQKSQDGLKIQYASLIRIIIVNEIFGLRVFESKGRLRYDWSIIYASICIILYAIYTNEIININYKNWPAYQEISYKLIMYINIIGIIIFMVLGMLNTEVSIFKTTIMYNNIYK